MPHTVSQAAKERGFFNSLTSSTRQLNNTITAESKLYIINIVNDTADFIHTVSGSTYSPAVGHFVLIKRPYSVAVDPIDDAVFSWSNSYNEFVNATICNDKRDEV